MNASDDDVPPTVASAANQSPFEALASVTEDLAAALAAIQDHSSFIERQQRLMERQDELLVIQAIEIASLRRRLNLTGRPRGAPRKTRHPGYAWAAKQIRKFLSNPKYRHFASREDDIFKASAEFLIRTGKAPAYADRTTVPKGVKRAWERERAEWQRELATMPNRLASRSLPKPPRRDT